MLLKINVTEQLISVNFTRLLVSDSVGFWKAQIILDDEWDGLNCKILFYTDTTSKDLLIPEDGVVDIPPEVLTPDAKLKFTVSGYADDGRELHTKEMLSTVTVYPAGKYMGDDTEAYTPELWEQVMQKLNLQAEAMKNQQSDWEKNDSTDPSYIKNRPFYETAAFNPISWDGSTEGRDTFTYRRRHYNEINLKFYKVSDEFISLDEIKNSTIIVNEYHENLGQWNGGYNANTTGLPTEIYHNRNDLSCIGYLVDDPMSEYLMVMSSANGGTFTIHHSDSSVEYTFTIPSAGTYMWFNEDLADAVAIDMQPQKTVVPLDEKFLPPNVLKKSDVDQTYDPESENAQSGKAVAEVTANKPTIYSGTDVSIPNPSLSYASVGQYVSLPPYKVGDIYINTDEGRAYICTNINISDSKDIQYNYDVTISWKGTNYPVSAKYNPESNYAQSGKATAEGIALSVGDINAVLATVISGSAVLPQSIVNKVVEKAAAGVEKQVGGRFITAVAVKDTGSIEVEPNAAYFIISNSESGKITVYDRTTEEPVEFTGKMIGMITGNYGDTNPSSVLGLVGIYSSAIIRKGTYLAIDSSKTATFSWTGEATVVTVKNVKGE